MISTETALRLKNAGLKWTPRLHDLFSIPESDLEDHVFVISDVQATVESLSGTQVVSFQGASEWALDHIVTNEAVWLLREDQLRQALEEALFEAGLAGLSLEGAIDRYTCKIPYGGQILSFIADNASGAYASALLFILDKRNNPAG